MCAPMRGAQCEPKARWRGDAMIRCTLAASGAQGFPKIPARRRGTPQMRETSPVASPDRDIEYARSSHTVTIDPRPPMQSSKQSVPQVAPSMSDKASNLHEEAIVL